MRLGTTQKGVIKRSCVCDSKVTPLYLISGKGFISVYYDPILSAMAGVLSQTETTQS